jgi:hypothetical protein
MNYMELRHPDDAIGGSDDESEYNFDDESDAWGDRQVAGESREEQSKKGGSNSGGGGSEHGGALLPAGPAIMPMSMLAPLVGMHMERTEIAGYAQEEEVDEPLYVFTSSVVSAPTYTLEGPNYAVDYTTTAATSEQEEGQNEGGNKEGADEEGGQPQEEGEQTQGQQEEMVGQEEKEEKGEEQQLETLRGKEQHVEGEREQQVEGEREQHVEGEREQQVGVQKEHLEDNVGMQSTPMKSTTLPSTPVQSTPLQATPIKTPSDKSLQSTPIKSPSVQSTLEQSTPQQSTPVVARSRPVSAPLSSSCSSLYAQTAAPPQRQPSVEKHVQVSLSSGALQRLIIGSKHPHPAHGATQHQRQTWHRQQQQQPPQQYPLRVGASPAFSKIVKKRPQSSSQYRGPATVNDVHGNEQPMNRQWDRGSAGRRQSRPYSAQQAGIHDMHGAHDMHGTCSGEGWSSHHRCIDSVGYVDSISGRGGGIKGRPQSASAHIASAGASVERSRVKVDQSIQAQRIEMALNHAQTQQLLQQVEELQRQRRRREQQRLDREKWEQEQQRLALERQKQEEWQRHQDQLSGERLAAAQREQAAAAEAAEAAGRQQQLDQPLTADQPIAYEEQQLCKGSPVTPGVLHAKAMNMAGLSPAGGLTGPNVAALSASAVSIGTLMGSDDGNEGLDLNVTGILSAALIGGDDGDDEDNASSMEAEGSDRMAGPCASRPRPASASAAQKLVGGAGGFHWPERKTPIAPQIFGW